MMRLRFIGQYTAKRDTLTLCGVTFIGREPADVTDAEAIRRLSNHPEFETVAPALPVHDVPPKKRGRPKKEAE